MIGFNGGLIGAARETSGAPSVPGVWTPREQLKAKRTNLWPIISDDPYFANVSLLLLGKVQDESSNAYTLSVTGSVAESTTYSVEGGSSIVFPNESSHIVLSGTSAASFGSDDYTVEFWVRVENPSWKYIFGPFFGIGTYGNSNQITVGYGSDGTISLISGSTGRGTSRGTDGVFHHVALSRQSGVIRTFYDGIYLGNGGVQSLVTNPTIYINRVSAYSNSGVKNGMYIDFFRITKNFARYTSNFTPPVA